MKLYVFQLLNCPFHFFNSSSFQKHIFPDILTVGKAPEKPVTLCKDKKQNKNKHTLFLSREI